MTVPSFVFIVPSLVIFRTIFFGSEVGAAVVVPGLAGVGTGARVVVPEALTSTPTAAARTTTPTTTRGPSPPSPPPPSLCNRCLAVVGDSSDNACILRPARTLPQRFVGVAASKSSPTPDPSVVQYKYWASSIYELPEGLITSCLHRSVELVKNNCNPLVSVTNRPVVKKLFVRYESQYP